MTVVQVSTVIPAPSDRLRLEAQTTNLVNLAEPASTLVQGNSPNISRSLETRCTRGRHETLYEHHKEAGRQSVTAIRAAPRTTNVQKQARIKGTEPHLYLKATHQRPSSFEKWSVELVPSSLEF